MIISESRICWWFLIWSFGGNKCQITEHMLMNGSDFELHKIFSECASFITKNILNLTQLLIERCTFNFSTFHSPFTEHKLILVNKIFLEKFNHFYWHNKWNRNHCIDKDKISEENNDRIYWCRVSCPINIIVIINSLVSEHTVKYGNNKAEQYLNTQYNTQNIIDFSLNLRHFLWCLCLWVFHNFRVFSCVNYQSENVISVHQFCSSVK